MLGWAGQLLFIVALSMVALEVVGALRAPDLPDEAPAFALSDLEGRTVTLAELRGRQVVVNFWATWCTPCRLEIPTFSRFARAHPDVVVLGVAVDEDVELVRRTAEELEIDYPVLLADPAVRQAYGVTTLPTTVIVGADGKVRSAHTGLMLDPHLLWATR